MYVHTLLSVRRRNQDRVPLALHPELWSGSVPVSIYTHSDPTEYDG